VEKPGLEEQHVLSLNAHLEMGDDQSALDYLIAQSVQIDSGSDQSIKTLPQQWKVFSGMAHFANLPAVWPPPDFRCSAPLRREPGSSAFKLK
jgi:hypothetical protein